MSAHPEMWEPTADERVALHDIGVSSVLHQYFEEHVTIRDVRNVRYVMGEDQKNYMEIRVKWVKDDGRRLELRRLRFGDERPVNLSEDQMKVLGKCAVDRPTDVTGSIFRATEVQTPVPEPVAA